MSESLKTPDWMKSKQTIEEYEKQCGQQGFQVVKKGEWGGHYNSDGNHDEVIIYSSGTNPESYSPNGNVAVGAFSGLKGDESPEELADGIINRFDLTRMSSDEVGVWRDKVIEAAKVAIELGKKEQEQE